MADTFEQVAQICEELIGIRRPRSRERQKEWVMIESSAVISPCGLYRYILVRCWDSQPMLGALWLNPSTADARDFICGGPLSFEPQERRP
jgi:hypothetical protein